VSTDNDNVQAEAPHALLDFINCPDWGKGGSYIYDPATKIRIRVESEDPATEAQAQAASAQLEAAPTADTPTTVKKERTRA
jgi:hypothetical protein